MTDVTAVKQALARFAQGLPLIEKQAEDGVPSYIEDATLVVDAARAYVRLLEEGREVEVHQDVFGRPVVVMADNPMADAADNLKSGRKYLVIPVSDDGSEDV